MIYLVSFSPFYLSNNKNITKCTYHSIHIQCSSDFWMCLVNDIALFVLQQIFYSVCHWGADAIISCNLMGYICVLLQIILCSSRNLDDIFMWCHSVGSMHFRTLSAIIEISPFEGSLVAYSMSAVSRTLVQSTCTYLKHLYVGKS